MSPRAVDSGAFERGDRPVQNRGRIVNKIDSGTFRNSGTRSFARQVAEQHELIAQ
jgi:hypothetical protein